MTKHLSLIILLLCLSCQSNKSLIKDTVSITVYPYEDQGKMHASAMPEIKKESELMKYEKRFFYLLLNVPEIHLREKVEERNEIGKLYPDTTEIKRLYLEKYAGDKRLTRYFEETVDPIQNPNLKIKKIYSEDELMEVASKFFYCDLVNPDTTIQAHVCVGLNGVKEANWKKDFTILEAFCYEAIFADFENENSQVWESFVAEKDKSCQQLRPSITTFNQYLEDVKLDLFKRMKNDSILKKSLLAYYELNKLNLAFRIEK